VDQTLEEELGVEIDDVLLPACEPDLPQMLLAGPVLRECLEQDSTASNDADCSSPGGCPECASGRQT
jgi:hypothetical protein